MVLLHPHYGILEFLSPPLLILMLAVLWTVSMIGLYKSSYSKTSKGLLAVLFVVMPPAAIIWIGMELYHKNAVLSGEAEIKN